MELQISLPYSQLWYWGMVLSRDKCLAIFPLRFIKGRIKTASRKTMQGPPRHSCTMGKKSRLAMAVSYVQGLRRLRSNHWPDVFPPGQSFFLTHVYILCHSMALELESLLIS